MWICFLLRANALAVAVAKSAMMLMAVTGNSGTVGDGFTVSTGAHVGSSVAGRVGVEVCDEVAVTVYCSCVVAVWVTAVSVSPFAMATVV
jgi:hypothetical protein